MTLAAIMGVLFVVVMFGAGVAAIVFRSRIAAWNAQANRDSFGKFGERVAKNSTPAWPVIIGVGLILVGAVSLLRVLFPGSP
ncbi:MAG: hypothetical protein M3N46_01060 [Actinomycetota bacterium]|nr:hypothetical protein [Actinomycetota bacterium]